MGIDPTPCARSDDPDADTGAIQRRNRQNKKQTLQRLGGLEFARLDLKAARFIVQEVLFDVEPQRELVQGRHSGRLIAHDIPRMVRLVRWSGEGQMHRADTAPEEPHVLIEMGLPDRWTQLVNRFGRVPWPLDQCIPSQAQAKMPIVLLGILNEPFVQEPPIAQQGNDHAGWHDGAHLIQDALLGLEADHGAGARERAPGQRDGPATLDQRSADQDEGGQDGRVQRHIGPGARYPVDQGGLQQRRIPLRRIDGGVV